MNETIVAQTTPMGRGGVAVIRMSGAKSLSIIKQCFTSKRTTPSKGQGSLEGGTRPDCVLPHAKMTYGIVTTEVLQDDGYVVYFASPHSYTGEDTVEINCHGNQIIVDSILKRLVSLGARLARPGEFTMRALLGGKMDLVQAEAVHDLICSESLQQVEVSRAMLVGDYAQGFDKVGEGILSILAPISAALDYPDDIDLTAEYPQFVQRLQSITQEIATMCDSFERGRRQKNGVRIAIVGQTNAGKSSLINALLGYDRAIVTEIAGTTRDVVTDEYEFLGIKFFVSDTAGVRETSDIVEKKGIQKTYEQMTQSDVLLDLGGVTYEGVYVGGDFCLSKNTKIIKVHNKVDAVPHTDSTKFAVSAKCGTHIEALKKHIFDQTIDHIDVLAINNQRHYDTLTRTQDCIQSCIQSLAQNQPLDKIASDLNAAHRALSAIKGINATDQILDQIFSKFCLGK
ncbi:MAG: tRNA uridine-5-carboxymethylaminomethyl(34) synthesis GTPase MnmE [Firmicutes bacterium]|nr:tRNA uridine-5-carboxymethylaminomethyl(34) synthesis GTPase MnmE [Bacillota bacterium]